VTLTFSGASGDEVDRTFLHQLSADVKPQASGTGFSVAPASDEAEQTTNRPAAELPDALARSFDRMNVAEGTASPGGAFGDRAHFRQTEQNDGIGHFYVPSKPSVSNCGTCSHVVECGAGDESVGPGAPLAQDVKQLSIDCQECNSGMEPTRRC